MPERESTLIMQMGLSTRSVRECICFCNTNGTQKLNWGVLYQKQASRTGTCTHTPLYIDIVLTSVRRPVVILNESDQIFLVNYVNTMAADALAPCVDRLSATMLLTLQDRRPDSKVHGANMGPTWVLSAPDRSHVGPMNLAIRAGHPLPRRICFHQLYYDLRRPLKKGPWGVLKTIMLYVSVPNKAITYHWKSCMITSKYEIFIVPWITCYKQ